MFFTWISRQRGNIYGFQLSQYGKEDGHITVEVHGEQQAVLCVRDDGIGIREEDMKRIFDRFYRADSSRTSSGCGLGLSMVKAIADLHGADIKVDSQVGEGSTFSVSFPKDFPEKTYL